MQSALCLLRQAQPLRQCVRPATLPYRAPSPWKHGVALPMSPRCAPVRAVHSLPGTMAPWVRPCTPKTIGAVQRVHCAVSQQFHTSAWARGDDPHDDDVLAGRHPDFAPDDTSAQGVNPHLEDLPSSAGIPEIRVDVERQQAPPGVTDPTKVAPRKTAQRRTKPESVRRMEENEKKRKEAAKSSDPEKRLNNIDYFFEEGQKRAIIDVDASTIGEERVYRIMHYVDRFRAMSEKEKAAELDKHEDMSPSVLVAFNEIVRQVWAGTLFPQLQLRWQADKAKEEEEKKKTVKKEPQSVSVDEIIADEEVNTGDLAKLPVNLTRILTRDEAKHVSPRQILEYPQQLGSGNPIAERFHAELRNVLASNKEAGTDPNDVEQARQLFDLTYGLSFSEYIKYVDSLGPNGATSADVTLEYASMVAEYLYALVAFSRQDLIAKRQFAVDDQVSVLGQAAVLKQLRNMSAIELPTHRDMYCASGVLTRAVQLKGFDRHIRRYPTSFVFNKYLENLKKQAKEAGFEDVTSASQAMTSFKWLLDDFHSLLPAWEDMEILLGKAPFHSTDFRKYLAETKQNEILTKECISVLSKYICERIPTVPGSLDREVVVLGVSSDYGRLLHFTRQAVQNTLTRQSAPVRVSFKSICLPSQAPPSHGSSKRPRNVRWTHPEHFDANPPVEVVELSDALTKYSPDIVLCSWLPAQVDVTATIRACSSVQEYILLGEAESGVCGDVWNTWGCTNFNMPLPAGHGPPPYQTDGFEKEYIQSVSGQQLCMNDTVDLNGLSEAFSFRRRQQ